MDSAATGRLGQGAATPGGGEPRSAPDASTADRVLYATRNCETFGTTEGYSIPLLLPSDGRRIAERHGAEDGKAVVQELRDSGFVRLDPQGRMRTTAKGLEQRAAELAALRAEHERETLATRERAREHFVSLFEKGTDRG